MSSTLPPLHGQPDDGLPLDRQTLVLGGSTPLTIGSLVGAARHPGVMVTLSPDAVDRVRANARLASDIAARDAHYGRTTGVGANRHVAADNTDGQHGLRLLRSHTAGAGRVLTDDVGRAVLVVRANQLSGGRSGIDAAVPLALIEALGQGLAPVVRSHGGVGTGDITVLAELGLSLLGERPWSDGSTRRFLDTIDSSGGLPLMSSSAPTLAVAALALHDLHALSDSMFAIAALGAHAVRANPEAWSEVGASTRPHRGMVDAGRRMRALLDNAGYTPARLQDPFSWRCITPVQGALLDALAHCEEILTVDLNASVENPIYDGANSFHQGGFHHGGLALALDHVRLALVQAAGLSLSRLTKLNDPSITGLRPFLAEGPAGSSGTMVLEYTAASALAELRQCAQPATLGTTAISLGLEDHASFAWQAALATRTSLEPLLSILACELVAALRGVRQHRDVPAGTPLDALVQRCASIADVGVDHALVEDIDAAASLLGSL